MSLPRCFKQLSVTLSARFPTRMPFVDKLPSTLFFQIKLPPPTHPPKKLFGVTAAFHSRQDAHNGMGRTGPRGNGETSQVVFQGAMFPWPDFTNFSPLLTLQIRNTLNELHTDQGQVGGNRSTLSPQHVSPPVALAHLQDTFTNPCPKPHTRKVSPPSPTAFHMFPL